MDIFVATNNLRKLLPDVDLQSIEASRILVASCSTEDKLKSIVTATFENKLLKYKNYANTVALNKECAFISTLFPSLSKHYIIKLLEIFVDMPNRKEIVLRLLIPSKNVNPQTSSLKRPAPFLEVLDTVNNRNGPIIKTRKLEQLLEKSKPPSATITTNELQHGLINETQTTVLQNDFWMNDLADLSYQNEPVMNHKPIPCHLDPNYVLQPPALQDQEVKVFPDEPNTARPFNFTSKETVTTSNNYEQISVKTESSVKMADVDYLQMNNEVPPVAVKLENFLEPKEEAVKVDHDHIYVRQDSSLDLTSKKKENATSEESSLFLSYSQISTSLEKSPDRKNSKTNYTVSLTSPTSIKINKQSLNLNNTKPLGRLEETKVAEVSHDNILSKIEDTHFGEGDQAAALPAQNKTCDNNGMAQIKIEIKDEPEANEEVKKEEPAEAKAGPSKEDVERVEINRIKEEIMALATLLEGEKSVYVAEGAKRKVTSAKQQVNKVEKTPKYNVDMKLVNSLCSIFPDACPNYVRQLCHNKQMNDEVLDELITTILDVDGKYPKRNKPAPEPEIFPENQFEILKEFLPDADPDYLRMMCDKFEGKLEMVKEFINSAMEKRDYPTMKDYQRRQQLSAQQKQYTSEFNVENFIKVIPDPAIFFSDSARKLKLSPVDLHYTQIFLKNKFCRLPVKVIQKAFATSDYNISRCIAALNIVNNNSEMRLKSYRKALESPYKIENIPLLQELAYYTHEEEINEFLKKRKELEEAERQEAKNNGLLKTCSCCYDDEVLPKDIYRCENGCTFCKSCILKSAEVRFGEGKLDFPCLMSCGVSFSLQTLQAVLPPKLFSKIAQKKTLEEVKAAGVEDLEMCPFCDFATIPAEGYTIFTCMNPECMKESCRMCKEPSHIPLRCDEIEKDADVKARTYVENQMTEALLRKCWKCGVKFFKEEGCNKMTCSCGAQMCYICGAKVTSYNHFNGNGGDRFDLCPLYSDTNVINKENVLKGAQQAIQELGDVNLKNDPTVGINQYFDEKKKKFPHDHLLVGQQFQPRVERPLVPRPPFVRRRVEIRVQRNDQGNLGLRIYDVFGQRQ